ncbi:MAG: hypothetical protein GXO22_05030 [Aquificae bacterium]|nr:hypothetical protein [Aquificota bacterium]
MDFLNIILSHTKIRIFINGKELRNILKTDQIPNNAYEYIPILLDIGEEYNLTSNIKIKTDIQNQKIIWNIKNIYNYEQITFKFDFLQYKTQIEKIKNLYIHT